MEIGENSPARSIYLGLANLKKWELKIVLYWRIIYEERNMMLFMNTNNVKLLFLIIFLEMHNLLEEK